RRRVSEGARDLSGSIWPEIEEDDPILIPDPSDWLSSGVDNHRWFHELVGFTRRVAFLDGFPGAANVFSLAKYVRRVGPIGTFPAVVAIHAVIAADHRSDSTDS